MKTRRLGISALIVSELGFGCMGLNSVYGEADDEEAFVIEADQERRTLNQINGWLSGTEE